MPDNYATAVLYKADIERELYNRATGVDAEDYILVDSLCRLSFFSGFAI